MQTTENPGALGFDQQRLARIRPWMQRYVDAGKLPGALTLIARRGEIAFIDSVGHRDAERRFPLDADTLVRIYSMTKPISSVGLMMLYEEGIFHLDDPVAAYVPELADLKVLKSGATSIDDTEPCRNPPTIHHVLTHTSGFSYGMQGGVLGEAMATAKLDFGPRRGGLDRMIGSLAEMPLLFHPGSRWNYGVSTDVVGRLIEVIAGKRLDIFLRERIFEPLVMGDTGFGAPADKLDRYADCFRKAEDGSMQVLETANESIFHAEKADTFSGGGGLVSTARDYLRFAEMLRRNGRVGDDWLIGPRTLSFMTRNHLPGDLASMGQPVFAQTSYEGIGFGLGFWVMLDPTRSGMVGSAGDHGWGGMASTVFWVDPIEDMVVIFISQLVPSSAHPIDKELRALVYQALTD